MEFVFTSGLRVIESGMLFSIAIKKFDQEAAMIIKQRIIGIH